MAWAKPSPRLIARFDRALPADPRIERRQMFGCPCAFTGGQMFAGLFQEQLFVRLGEAERAALLAEPGAAPFVPMPGRVMREYVCVPRPLTSRRLPQWLLAAFAYAASLPPKATRPRTRRAVRRPR